MRAAAIALLLATTLAAPALAQPGRGGPPRGGGDDGISVEEAIAGVLFGATAEREIRSYFQTHSYAPQGLPPGIARNLARGKPLPPGIAKRYPPNDLLARLPAYPGHEILIAGNDVLLVATATQVVVDILRGVL